MLLAYRSVLQQHREVAAVLITYGMFLCAVLGLAWAAA
jgi:Tfp pilus assembly protein PilF